MPHNVVKICMGCGRTFIARNSGMAFCCKACKKRYSYHYTFKCRDCRNAACEVRNERLQGCAFDCPNLKWNP
ncbi:hypothetical protein D6853_14615 [Butyrivibrio sp. X503]|nr:hypothetical protein D6853_14615 [Butyrivibrio sp. X503]